MSFRSAGLGLLVLFLLTFASGCSHHLEVKNLGEYRNNSLVSLPKKLSIGVMPAADNPAGKALVKSVGTELSKYSADVVLPYSSASSRNVDVIAKISIGEEYHGSGWNFLINFPGFLVWAPAWNGYVYKASYDVDVQLMNAASNEVIDSFKVPINLNIRHSDMDRTWTEISWLEVGAIALISGFVFIQYDDDVTPLLSEKIGTPVGDYLAQEIATRISNYRNLASLGTPPPTPTL